MHNNKQQKHSYHRKHQQNHHHTHQQSHLATHFGKTWEEMDIVVEEVKDVAEAVATEVHPDRAVRVEAVVDNNTGRDMA